MEAVAWPPGDGEMARRIRERDWAATALGPSEHWPDRLRCAVELVLAMPYPACISWGPDLLQIYNDRDIPSYGHRHPAALGRPLLEALAGSADMLKATCEQLYAAAQTLAFEDQPFASPGPDGGVVKRWLTGGWTPIRDDAGEVAGLIRSGVDTTDRVLSRVALGESEAGYRALFASMDEAYAIVEVIADQDGRWCDFRFLEANPAFMKHSTMPYPVGKTATELLGTPNPRWAEIYGQVAETGVSVRFEEAEMTLGLVFDLNVFRLGSPGSRRVAVLFSDITSRKRDEAALRRVAARDAFRIALTDALRVAIDPVETQAIAMQMLGEHLGAGRVMYGEADPGSTETFTNHRECRRDTTMPSSIGPHRWDDFGPYVAAEFRAGRTLVVNDVRAHPNHSEGELAAYEAVGIRAYLAVPVVRGDLIAYLAVNQGAPRVWTPDEIALIEEVAERTWAAVERARAQITLAETERRQAFLLKLGDALRPLSDPVAVQTFASAMLGRHLGLDRCAYGEVDESETFVTIHRDYHVSPVASVAGRHRIADFGEETAATLRRGGIFSVEDAHLSPLLSDPDVQAGYAALEVRAAIAVPLVKSGRLEAVLTVHQTSPRAWSPHELQLLEEVAERSWDAVERARDATALRNTEERLRLVVEGARNYAIFTTDTQGRIDDWYAGAQAVFGYAAAEVVGRHYAMIFTPEDCDAGIPYAELSVAREHGLAPDMRWHLRKDGGRVFIDGRTVPLRDGACELRGFLKIGLDVTRRHLIEEALRESEERFRQFAEYSSDVIWIRDAEALQFEYVSPAVESVYGVAPDRFLDAGDDLKRWVEILHPDDRAHALAVFDDVRMGERVTHEFRICRPDGAERWIRDTTFPLLDADDRVQRIAGIGKDVTELKHAEAAIQESETRLRTLTEGIPQLVWRSCNEGRWTWASPQWCDFTGQTQAQSQGMGWLDVVHHDDRFAAMKAWNEAVPSGMLDTEYRVFRTHDRAWVWHHTRSVPVRDASGTITEWLGTSTDIQALRELQERQGVLVAELQHRTRNLIGVVRSVADKSIRASADLPDFRERFGHRMQALSRVQGLLSRLGEGERVTFDALLRAEMTAMDAVDDPRVMLDGPVGVTLRSGSVQTLAMAIHELATNALKYGALSPMGESARLRVQWALLPASGGERPQLHIVWRETGVIMPAGSASSGSGQGRELIERALPYQLDARTTYVLEADGVACSIIVPVSSRVFEDRVHA